MVDKKQTLSLEHKRRANDCFCTPQTIMQFVLLLLSVNQDHALNPQLNHHC